MTHSSSADFDSSWRILLCHKHPMSARLRFLIPEQNGVVLPEPLPSLAVIANSEQEPSVLSHPASALAQLKQQWAVDNAFEIFSEFRLRMEVPGGLMPVYLGILPGDDLCPAPPGLRWIDLPQSIGMPWLDREILRRAYEVLIG